MIDFTLDITNTNDGTSITSIRQKDSKFYVNGIETVSMIRSPDEKLKIRRPDQKSQLIVNSTNIIHLVPKNSNNIIIWKDDSYYVDNVCIALYDTIINIMYDRLLNKKYPDYKIKFITVGEDDKEKPWTFKFVPDFPFPYRSQNINVFSFEKDEFIYKTNTYTPIHYYYEKYTTLSKSEIDDKMNAMKTYVSIDEVISFIETLLQEINNLKVQNVLIQQKIQLPTDIINMVTDF